MIRSYTVNIKEVDDAEFALDELNGQMAGVSLLKNTVGIVSINLEYISSGVYAAIAKALDFPLVGGTSISIATNAEIGTFLFSILILTSDDCEFSCAVSDTVPQKGSVRDITQQCYKDALEGLKDDVKLMFLFAPVNENHYSDKYLLALSALNERVPVFGTLILDETDGELHGGKTLLGENSFDDRLVLVAVSGAVEPQFYIGSVSEECIIMPDVGIVTKSDENLIIEINHMNAEGFFQKIGYDVEKFTKGTQTSGFVMREKDKNGKVLSSTINGPTSVANDGAVAFACHVTEGEILSVMNTSKEDILTTARDAVKRIKENHNGGTVIMYPCVGRMFALLNEPMKENAFLRDELSEKFNFLLAGSGGEICPTLVTDAKTYNKGHGHTLVACVF